jgi:hypothetical protein
MKKLTLLFLAAFVFLQTAQAQYEGPGPVTPRRHGVPRGGSTPWRFGVFLAPTVSWMKPTNSKSNDGMHRVYNDGSKVGFTWGLMADYYISYNYAIETGFQLNNGGGLISTEHVTNLIPSTGAYISSTNYDYSLQYLEVPFNLKLVSDPIGGGLTLFGQLGVSGGINLSKKATYSVTYVDDSDNAVTLSGEKERIEGSLAVSPILFSLNVGGGLEYPVSERLSFYLGLFFNNGFAPDVTNPANYLLDYTNATTAPEFRDGNTRLNNFAVRLGMFF